MTTLEDTATTTARPATTTLMRVAGGLAIAFPVVMFAGFSQEVSVTHDDSLATLHRVYGGANATRVFAGGYVEAMSFLILAATLVLMPGLVGQRTETGRMAGRAFAGLGWALIAATYAVGFPAGAAALYGVQHGADLHSAAMINDLRNYGLVLQTALQAGMAVALGIAALAERRFPRWGGWGGIVAGAACLVGAPFVVNAVSTVWLLWWVGLGVLLLRAPRQGASR